MSTSSENPFGPNGGSMGDWLLEGKLRPRRVRKPSAEIKAALIDLPETVQPVEVKTSDQLIVVKVGPTK